MNDYWFTYSNQSKQVTDWTVDYEEVFNLTPTESHRQQAQFDVGATIPIQVGFQVPIYRATLTLTGSGWTTNAGASPRFVLSQTKDTVTVAFVEEPPA